jgi:TonB-dependent starch-binding outer membrane protein SusC
MKKKLKLLFTSHLYDRFGLIMRFCFLAGLLVTLQLSASESTYAAGSSSGANDVLIPQQVKITGTVTGTDGTPIPGVNVVVTGTALGTVTDVAGKYSIDVPRGSKSLRFSFIGMETQDINIGTLIQIDVTMVESGIGLNEVVVTGYGTSRRSDLTGSVSSVKTEELLRLPTQRVDQAIQGRTTGVFILNTDGSPGGNTMIRIRGLNSINGGNEPLIVIDGLQGGNINSLNPNDIASMEILKDASATAIYGSRGANGVILITTKLGKKGKPVIDAGYNIGLQNLARKLPVMEAGDYARYINFIRSLDTGQGNIPTPIFSDAEIAYYDKNGGTDWQDVVYQTGVLQNTNLAISGATDQLKYMVSGNYLDHQGILVNSKYTRISLRANLSADVTKWCDFGLNYAYTKETYKSPSFKDEVGFVSQVVNNAPRWAPTEPVYDENGNYWKHRSGYGPSDTWNPLASAMEPVIDNPTYRNNANLFLNFKILKGLSLKIQGGAQYTNEYYNDYYNANTLSGLQNNGYGNVNKSLYERYQNTNILTYDNTFGDHHITFTGVLEQIAEEGKGSNINARDFLVDQLGIDNLGGANKIVTSSWHNKRGLLSYMGRINYVWKEKYLATVSYRADASSVFGENNKWGYFPSGSLAWRISQEGFLRDSPIINDLKLRVSYGITGNQGISPYQSLASLGSGQWYSYPWNGQATTDIGFGVSGIANPELKWESTSQTDIGLDLSMFKGRLTSTIDVYRKVTDDLLMPRELPGYVGVSSVLDNIGSIQNQGLEIMIGGDPLVGKFRWNTSLNFTMNRNKVLDLGPDDRIGFRPSTGGYNLGSDFMFLQVGQPFGLMNGWKWLGLWGADEDAEARSYGKLPGMNKYLDVNKDGQIDNLDRTTIGNGYPKYTIGWTNLFTYNNFELSFLIISNQGNDLFNTMRIRRETYEANDPKMLDYWTSENQDSKNPALYDGKYVEDQLLINKYFFGNSSGATSQWVEDASFIRLKTITLAYSMDQKLLKRIGFTKARFYVSGTNLLTITDYTGYDPEVAAFTYSDATIGTDLSVYPPARMWTFGVDFTF